MNVFTDVQQDENIDLYRVLKSHWSSDFLA